MDGVRVSAADYERFFNETKQMSGRLRTRVRKRVRDSGKKYGPDIVAQGAEAMPRRGGLAAYVAREGRAPTIALRPDGADLLLGKKKGPQIGKLNEGQLRHPVFGVMHIQAAKRTKSGTITRRARIVRSDVKDRTTWKWVAQRVPAGSWRKAANKYLPEISNDVAREINEVLKELG